MDVCLSCTSVFCKYLPRLVSCNSVTPYRRTRNHDRLIPRCHCEAEHWSILEILITPKPPVGLQVGCDGVSVKRIALIYSIFMPIKPYSELCQGGRGLILDPPHQP